MARKSGCVGDLAGMVLDCRCGRVHRVEIKNIETGSGALYRLPAIMAAFVGGKVFMVSDINTDEAAGIKVEAMLKPEHELVRFVFEDPLLVPDAWALGRLLVEIPQDTGVILGVGSGTISDICRFLSCKLRIPYVMVATAPSMDGYASTVSPLVVNGIKTTYTAVYPYGIIADTDLLKEAPMGMLQAGMGDVLGKYTALADWQLSKIVNGEYFCQGTEAMVMKMADRCASLSPHILDRNEQAVESMIEALLYTGLAIGMVGSSRPASGEEHHLSHCWEAMSLNGGRPDARLHGNYVGVGSCIILKAYKYLAGLDIGEICQSGSYLKLDEQKWADNLVEIFGEKAQNIIDYKKESMVFAPEDRRKRIAQITANWDSIVKISRAYLPEPEQVIGALKAAGAATKPAELGLSRERFKKSMIAAKDIRKRYGVLQLLEDMGMLEEAAEMLAKSYYE